VVSVDVVTVKVGDGDGVKVSGIMVQVAELDGLGEETKILGWVEVWLIVGIGFAISVVQPKRMEVNIRRSRNRKRVFN